MATGGEATPHLEQREAEEAEGRDVAEDASLVAQPVVGPGVRQQGVELVEVLGRDFGPQLGGEGVGSMPGDVRIGAGGGGQLAEEQLGSLEDRRREHVEALDDAEAGRPAVVVDR